jgi:hypothetical protein
MHPRLSPSARNSSLTFRHPHTAVQKSSFGSKWHARYFSDRHLTRGTLYSVGATSLNQHMRRLTLSSEVGPEATTRSGLLHVTGQNSSPCATRYEQGVENRDGFDYVIERGAATVSWSALMHVMLGCGLAQYEPSALRKPSCGSWPGLQPIVTQQQEG